MNHKFDKVNKGIAHIDYLIEKETEDRIRDLKNELDPILANLESNNSPYQNPLY